MNIKELFTTWGFKVDDKALDAVDKKLARVRASADIVGKTSVVAFDRPRNSLNLIGEAASSARNSILALSAAYATGGFGLGGIFKIMSDFEQTEIAFETLIGNTEKAQKTLKDLQQFARATPFAFGDVAELSKKLLAYNFSAEELIPTMKALGDIAAGVGKDKLPQLVLALGQVRSATKLRGSELRQFTEAGVPLIGELATTLGVAEASVQSMVEAGKVGFDDVYKSLQRLTGEGGRLNNLMAKQSGTLGGIASNVLDTLEQIVVAVGKRGLLGRAKTFLQGILQTLETNREKIIEGTHHAIELVAMALEHIIRVGRGAWQIFDGMAQAVGGSRKALELLIKAMFIIVSAKMLFLLGKMASGVGGLAMAFVGLGDAALRAQIKIAAIAIAIGAAIAGIALIIEDVVAYFQGRKSVTGYILKDLGSLSGAFDKIMGPVFEKLKAFGSSIGRSIIDGIAALSTADWNKIGDVMLKALELMLLASTIPLRIGLAIAEGIVRGLEAGILEKFPKLASFLGIEAQGDASKETWGGGWLKSMQGGLPSLPSASMGPAGALAPGAPAGGPQINMQLTNNINVPPSTPPENVGPMVSDGVKRSMDSQLREAHRALKGQVAH